MPVSRFVLALVAAASSLEAQQLPALRIEAVGGGSVFYVTNTAAQPLTAWLIELVDYPGSSYSLFQDDVSAPLAPGAEKRIPVSNMTVGAAPEHVKITAAVFADGATAGDDAKAALIGGAAQGRPRDHARADREAGESAGGGDREGGARRGSQTMGRFPAGNQVPAPHGRGRQSGGFAADDSGHGLPAGTGVDRCDTGRASHSGTGHRGEQAPARRAIDGGSRLSAPPVFDPRSGCRSSGWR